LLVGIGKGRDTTLPSGVGTYHSRIAGTSTRVCLCDPLGNLGSMFRNNITIITVSVLYLQFLLPVAFQPTVLLEVFVVPVQAFPLVPATTTPTKTITSHKDSIGTQRQRQPHRYRYWLRTASPWQQSSSTITTTSMNIDDHNNSPESQSSSPPVYGLYEVQEEMLIQRGIYEEQLMSHTKSTPLLHIAPPPTSQKRNNPTTSTTTAKGFGSTATAKNTKSTSSSSKQNWNTEDAKHYASILRHDGLVRIDNIIPHNIIAEMKEFVLKLRYEASQESRFADVLLRKNRCDLKIPIGYNGTIVTPVVAALYHALCQSPVSETIVQVFHTGDTTKSSTKRKKATLTSDDNHDAILYELSCLISDYGSHRQVIHPDNPFRASTDSDNNNDDRTANTTMPTLLTCFIALQDIVNEEMGPTIFLPNTHTQYAHDLFAQDMIPTTATDQVMPPKDMLLRDSPTVLGTLTKGYVSLLIRILFECAKQNIVTSLISFLRSMSLQYNSSKKSKKMIETQLLCDL
jgi:hypothetical protein